MIIPKIIQKILSKATKTAVEFGAVALFICILPIVLLIRGIKAIPGVYDSAVEMVKNFIEKEVAEYNQYRIKKESLKHIKTFEVFTHLYIVKQQRDELINYYLQYMI